MRLIVLGVFGGVVAIMIVLAIAGAAGGDSHRGDGAVEKGRQYEAGGRADGRSGSRLGFLG